MFFFFDYCWCVWEGVEGGKKNKIFPPFCAFILVVINTPLFFSLSKGTNLISLSKKKLARFHGFAVSASQCGDIAKN